MKFNKSLVFMLLMGFVIAFSSCEDGKKKDQIKLEEQEAEMAKAESDAKEAEMKEAQANEEKMKEEARTNSIAGKAMASRDLDTLVIALKAAGLADMLLAEGDYTVFAPTDYAFSELKKGTLEDLVKPENKEMLIGVLQYHVVAGKMRSEDLGKAIDAGNGKAELTTVKGDKLTIMRDGDQIVIKDGKGKKAQIVLGNIDASNGVIHEVSKVLMSK
ncbi:MULTISPECIES: fasciclin domain-containing protein [unclassified Leeuwenhoekiella]|uniref:fasciclin domain-containing protein n=1 Tax=unclassified Leeuwenhoekiella TaxID=2615029 RepID=UPI00048CB837|nr:fasciclin domain-containing protein [Leeuwenhoekiella sp. MAR_2009_132]